MEDSGDMVEDEKGLVAIVTSYFMRIFELSNLEQIYEDLVDVTSTIIRR